ncbi:MAG: 1,4-dihydroxy-2-naphthoate octaprenyltransferase [Bacteroidales bacterium]|jgi:1,4-dihydroxy-2-naphthoate octaprenyltransferase|nr:1,4-dihydroxy-2-naphthoate octaprenyltransferase [Bacteroidales bacterium]
MQTSKLKYWILAARPKTLSASLMPVAVGCTLSYFYESFKLIPAIICLAFALLAQIISNWLNDYFDFKKGADRADRLGPGRAVANGWIRPEEMLRMAVGFGVLAFIIGLALMYYAGWKLIFTGLAVGLGAYAYSSGPYPLAYHGLGDICVVVFYGVIPVGFTCYVQILDWNTAVTVSGLALGLVSTNILVANNYRDREQDKISDKNTSVVIFGEAFGRWFYLCNGFAAIALCIIFIYLGMIWAAVLPCLYLIPHVAAWREMCRIRQGKELNRILAMSARNTVIFGLLLSAGILLS